MAQKLTADFVKSIASPTVGNKIFYDTEVREFGLRVTANGAKSFILNYRTQSGRERRYTIGRVSASGIGISLAEARTSAARLKVRIREQGFDPLQVLEDERSAPTIADLCKRFLAEHVGKRNAATTSAEYMAAIERVILPRWRSRKVAEIEFSDIDRLHCEITERGTRKGGGRGAPYQANRTVALLSKMFSLAIRWKWRADNPVRGIERNAETKRRRYLTHEELAALLRTLDERDAAVGSSVLKRRREHTANQIVRLLLLTGARSGETMAMRWGEINFKKGLWTKPSAHTKQKEEHEVPLSAPALLLLKNIRDQLPKTPKAEDPVFPSYGLEGTTTRKLTPQTTMKKSWSSIRQRATVLFLESEAEGEGAALVSHLRKSLKREPTLAEVNGAAEFAGIQLAKGLRDLRIHDLRHSYASFLVSEGLSLPTIGALLGHTQQATTARYAHLFDDPLRKATERVGQIVSVSTGPDTVVPLRSAEHAV
ncbi:MAG: site-specific integrase [Xanthobacteraceae bacterium]|nr:site-specific integrase [Xanthobacteraceae bacterium]